MNAAPPTKRFIVDTMLGKLAKWLRILGFDARTVWLRSQAQVAECTRDGFLVITRRQRWCGQNRVFCLSTNDPQEQLRELVSAVPIDPREIHPLERCVICNERLLSLAREEAFGRVPDHVFETHRSFYWCGGCHRVYWRGSHPQRIMERLQSVLGWSMKKDWTAS